MNTLKNIQKSHDYLNLKRVGFLELIFAITPMLSGFSLGTLPMGFLMWALLVTLVILRGNVRAGRFKPMILFIIYWALHELMMILVDNVNFNGEIQQVLFFIAFFLLFPLLDLDKLRGSLNWIALISIAGLLFQWGMVATGEGVHPLGIPGLTMTESRLEQISLRPSSFYMEPAAYATFMLCPLAIALMDKKYLWAIAIILSVLLTTSTTGLAVSFILLIMSLVGKRVNLISWIAIAAVCFGLFYAYTHLEIFEAGLDKIENTDATTNVRLSQGPHIVSTMQPSEYLFGAPYSTPYNYCTARNVTDVAFYGKAVYMSTFWYLILCYGIIGLLLYLNIFFQIARRSRVTWPLIACLIVTMFSSTYRFSNDYIFIMIVVMVMMRNDPLSTMFAKRKGIKV